MTAFLAEMVDALADMRNRTPVAMELGTIYPTRKAMVLLSHALPEDSDVLDYAAGLAGKLKSAQPFRFENVPCVRNGTRSVLPGIDREGNALFNANYVRLPFPACWLEYAVGDMDKAMLAEDDGVAMRVHEFSRSVRDGATYLQTYRYATKIHRFGADRPPPKEVEDLAGPEACAALDPTAHFAFTFDPMEHFQRVADYERDRLGEAVTQEALTRTLTIEPSFAVYLMLVLQSKERTVRTVTAKKFANKRRRDKGLFPIPDHYEVRMADGWAPGKMSLPPPQELAMPDRLWLPGST